MVSAKQRKIVRRIQEILRKRESSLVENCVGLTDVKLLPWDIRSKIVDELGEEFSERGLKPDSEPNDYGLEIEDLIDACGLS